MFDQTVQRIGFACKIQESQGKANPSLNTKTTTLTWLNKQTKNVAVERLYEIAEQNIQALQRQLVWVGAQPKHLRMFRLSSDLLPAYTHEDWMWAYFEPSMVKLLETGFAKVGELARKHDIKISFHPGQFCVLASENSNVVENSIQEFEYHCDIIRYMGYGQQFQDFKCNVHIGGKLGPEGIKQAVRKLSREARNTLTIENAEFTWGLDASLELVDTCALVVDIHHHWINTGEYLDCNDPKLEQVLESWRGVRPTLHYSVSREDLLIDHDTNVLPDFQQLKLQGFTSAKLRAHSDYYWNSAVNTWATSFLPRFDIMCESKEKNLASHEFAKFALDFAC
jgi:UV damage endonuclease UvdE